MKGTRTSLIPYNDPLLSGRMTIRRSISFPWDSLAMASWYRVFRTFSTCSGRALTGGRTGSGLKACRYEIVQISSWERFNKLTKLCSTKLTMPDMWHIWASSWQKERVILSGTCLEKLMQIQLLTVPPLIIFCKHPSCQENRIIES